MIEITAPSLQESLNHFASVLKSSIKSLCVSHNVPHEFIIDKVIDFRPGPKVAGEFRTDVALWWFYQNATSRIDTSAFNTAVKICKEFRQEVQKHDNSLLQVECTSSSHIVLLLQLPLLASESVSLSDISSTFEIPVLYQDSMILVVDKPAKFLSVPGVISAEIPSLKRIWKRVFPELRMVHRLDYDTSGVVVMALNKYAAQHLNEQFKNRSLQKTYVALCNNSITPSSGVISFPLAQDLDNPRKHVVDYKRGKASVSKYSVVLSSSEEDSDNSTRVILSPVTGRTHQLRVHLQAIGHPILGDELYNNSNNAERLCLHASEIELTHPKTNLKMTFKAPVPF